MKHQTIKLIEILNYEVETIDLGEESVSYKAMKAIKLLEDGFKELKKHISEYVFENEAEEIRFFKEVKPKLSSKFIYYRKVCNIEAMRPSGSNTALRGYLTSELDLLTCFFNRNIDFYKYFRSGSTILDRFYFLRGKHDIQLTTECFYFERDPKFSTLHDYTVATIMANELTCIYLNEELHKLEKQPENNNSDISPKIKLSWTDSKTSLVELIYAIQTKGSFNYGNADIKELTNYFCNVFNTDLGEYYRTYLNIRSRKENRTTYLDSLKSNLNQRMVDDDSK